MPNILDCLPINRLRTLIATTACAALALAASASAQSDIVLQASNASVKAGKWIGGQRQRPRRRHEDSPRRRRRAKVMTAAASPANYFELTFTATAGVPYRLWLHGRADGDDWDNDSVFVQFSGSVTSSGGAVYRIGTTSATEVNLEECKGCGLKELGVAGQRLGQGRARTRDLLREAPAPRPSASRRAKTGCRSTRSSCRRRPT